MIDFENSLIQRTQTLGHLSGLVPVDRFRLFYLSTAVGHWLQIMLHSLQ
jgi:hypothetical protein